MFELSDRKSRQHNTKVTESARWLHSPDQLSGWSLCILWGSVTCECKYSSILNSNKTTHLTRCRLRLSSTQCHSRSNLRNNLFVLIWAWCNPPSKHLIPHWCSLMTPATQLVPGVRQSGPMHWTHLTTCWEPAILLSDSRLYKVCKVFTHFIAHPQHSTYFFMALDFFICDRMYLTSEGKSELTQRCLCGVCCVACLLCSLLDCALFSL